MIELFIKISIPFYVAALVTGLYLFNKLDMTGKLLFFYLIVELTVELSGYYLRKNHLSNLWLYNIFILIETITFTWILSTFLVSTTIRTITIIVLSTFVLLWILYNLFINEISLFHPVVQVFQSLLLILLSGLILVNLSSSKQNLFQDSRFWFASAVFIFFITTIFVSAISSVITKPGYKGMENLWIINSIANIFSHILFIFYFLWNSRRKILSY